MNSEATLPQYQIPSPSRIQVVGTSCSGKSTFARQLSQILKIPYVELDALHWGPNWQESEPDLFQARVAKATEGESWIVDGSYGRKVGTVLSSQRNYIIWIDLGLPRILIRFFKRSITRSMTKELLWGGCRETLKNSIFQKDSLLMWILQNHHPSRVKYFALLENPPPSVTIIRLKSPHEVENFLASANILSSTM